MALPELPDSWFKMINLLWTIALSILGVLGYSALTYRQEKLEAGQVVGHQKIDAVKETQAVNGAKTDVVAAKLDATNAKVGELKTTLPPAVASEVQKTKGKD